MRRPTFHRLLALGLAGCVLLAPWPGSAALREPVHPRRTVEEFPPVPARHIRFTIHATNWGEPGFDAIEIYGPDDETRNLALAAHGGRATASGTLPGYAIHELAGINDGRYGNGRCWIADRREGAWVRIELPQPAILHRLVWSRDREGKFVDRLATDYVIEVSLDGSDWTVVASSADREPLPGDPTDAWLAPVARQFTHRFVPTASGLPADIEHPSPEYTIDRWQTSDGLPGNTVTALSQGPDGYLWLGTLNGLVRFDGIRFFVLDRDAGLPDPRVLALLHDRHGALWIGTEGGGLVRLQHGAFTRWTQDQGLPSDRVLSLAEDPRGRLWVGTAGGILIRDGSHWVPGPGGGSFDSPSVSRIVPVEDSAWCIVHSSIAVGRGAMLERPTVTGEPGQFTSMFALHRGPSGRLWFGGANNYLASVDPGADVVRIHPEQPGHLLNSVWEILETRNGDVWVGTANGGLRRWRDGRFLSITTQEGLSDNSIRSLFEDREGNLWIGTVGGGLNRLKPRRLTTLTTRDGLSHNTVMSLIEDTDGAIWVGSNCGGLSVGRQGHFAPYQPNYLLDNECVWSLAPAPDGALWIGTWGGGLFRLHGRDIAHFVLAQRHHDEPVTALLPDPDRGLWVGTAFRGVLWFHEGTFHSVRLEGLSGSHPVTSLLDDGRRGLWVGTGGGGLLHLSPDQRARATRAAGVDIPVRSIRRSRHDGLPSDVVRTLHRDASGTLWVGTDRGLARLQGDRIDAFTAAQGLPNEVISQILPDDLGHLWLGSNRGILRLSLDDLEDVARCGGQLNVATFGREEGLDGVECTGGFHPAGLKARDGTLWFSTVRGIVRVDPARFEPNRLPPPVLIERVLVDGHDGALPGDFLSSGSRADARRIEPGARRIEFHFTALSLVSPERNRFRYRLAGLEAAWVESGAQRVAAYTRVPPGRYRFEVQACNADGVWNLAGTGLDLRVLPPFWAQGWFLALTGGLALAVGGWSVRTWSLRKIRHQLETLERQHGLEKERARIARDIHDDLGSTLTQISLLTELARRRRRSPDDVETHLQQISEASREMVQAMDAIVWAVNPRNDSLDHLANYISQFAVSLFRLTPIRCRLDVPAHLPELPLPTEARHHLFLATKEALHNVVRHAQATEVRLRLAVEQGDFVIAVEDNGRGLTRRPDTGVPTHPGRSEPNRNGEGDGLRNIRQRLDEIGGRLAVRPHPEGGLALEFRLRLPGFPNLP
ncbi:MAG: ATP-binding protein [Verrucomicrobiae bacterium]|nr:ATP-binding protein [Verrucomicrobiae bacterium]